ncbi:hypothetical protein [Nocardia sp. SYP-A9097]|nr:hypothetical protein [Nocardia sp. SYP-A9097]
MPESKPITRSAVSGRGFGRSPDSLIRITEADTMRGSLARDTAW